tara:strand:- start:31 stop:216 length:186 start_codon:yes stop_codon:yes gene_type:complete
MSNEPTKKPKRKVVFIDEGFAKPDDPMFREGWTIGVPVNISNLRQLGQTSPSKEEEEKEDK